MSNKLTDEKLDELLEVYFSLEPDHVFSVRKEKQKRSEGFMNKTLLRTAAACACAAVILGGGAFAYTRISSDNTPKAEPSPTESTTSSDSAADDLSSVKAETMADTGTFFLQAFAQDVTQADVQKAMEAAQGVPTSVHVQDLNRYNQDNRPDYGKIWYDENMAYQYSIDDESKPIGMFPIEQCENLPDNVIAEPAPFIYITGVFFSISGDNIDHAVFESEKDAKLIWTNSGDDSRYFDPDPDKRYPKQLEITDISADKVAMIQYGARKIMYNGEDLGDVKDVPNISRQELIELREKRRAIFENITADGYNEYFGDTVTVTITYDDGSTSVSYINISFDDDGNYIISYS